MRSIAFWMPDTGNWGKVNPYDPFDHAWGGRETMCLRIAQELVKIGWDVAVYAPLDSPLRVERGNDDVVYMVPWEYRHEKRGLSRYDVVVSMERPDLFDVVRAKLNIVQYQCATPNPESLIGKRDRTIDHYFLLSNYQQFTLREHSPEINPDKCVIFGNGIDLERFDDLSLPKIPGRFVWSSSPDRGLYHLLRLWPLLKQKHPEISLKVFYNIEVMQSYAWLQEIRSEWAREIKAGADLPGVEYVGPVGQATLAREIAQASYFAYPCDPILPTETWCVTALEHAAARNAMLLSDADCLYEVYGGNRKAAHFVPLPILDREWLGALDALLTNPEFANQNIQRARSLAEQFTWFQIANRWSTFLDQRLEVSDPEQALVLAEDTSSLAVSLV